MEDGNESSHKNVRRSASYVRKVHDLLVEFSATPEDLEVLSQIQIKRVGLGEFVTARPDMPMNAWGHRSFQNRPAWDYLKDIFNFKDDLSDYLDEELESSSMHPTDAEVQAHGVAVCETIATILRKGRSKTKKYYFGVFLDDEPVPRAKLRKDAVKFVEMILKDSELKKKLIKTRRQQK